MLRALAGYFFGGPQDGAQQEQLECETKEVNDWLVVNMPDQPQDNIDFDEEVADEDMEDMDDVLNCLSTWFAIPHLEIRNNDEEDENSPSQLPRIQLLYSQDPLLYSQDLLYIQECVQEPSLKLEENLSRPIWTSIWHTYKHYADSLKNSNNRRRMIAGSEDAAAFRGDVQKDLFQQRLKGKRVVKTSDVTCHPVYSKTYVNHRHPAVSQPKTDLLQKIKDLEPEQRANQHAMKKHMTRGQINRQNKNYIYDTSTKKNRRKNLQRNPSGANNNRKCNY